MKKLFSLALALIMVLALCAPAMANGISEGTLTALTSGGVVSGNTVTFDSPIAIQKSEADSSTGRQDAWYVGVQITAPEGYSADATYKSGTPRLNPANTDISWSEAKSFKDQKDGDNYIGLWVYLSDTLVDNYVKAGKEIVYKYQFDWDNKDGYEQTIDIVIDPTAVTLMEGETTVYPKDYTITITPPSIPSEDQNANNETYKAYKIFDATFEGAVVDAATKISYTISESNPFYDYIADKDDWFTLTEINGTGVYFVTPTDVYTDAKAIELADALKDIVDNSDPAIEPVGTVEKVGPNFELTVADKGYYFITSTLGSDIIVDTLADVTVQSKNEYPSLTKKADKTNASFGEIITYTLTISVPGSVDKEVVVTDTMEDGLTFKQFTSAAVDGVTTANNGQVNTITIAPTADSTARTVTVTYEAYINTAAGEIFGEKNTNEAYLTYSEYESAKVSVDVVSYEVSYKKVDGKTGDPLAGVTFKLTDANGVEIKLAGKDGEYRVADSDTTDYAGAIITDANGVFEIEGLGNGTYKLVELSTLDGYNLLESPVSFNINGDNNMDNVVVNNSGLILPSTGGVGTTIFTVVGALLMGAAFILFVTKKKMANEQ